MNSCLNVFCWDMWTSLHVTLFVPYLKTDFILSATITDISNMLTIKLFGTSNNLQKKKNWMCISLLDCSWVERGVLFYVRFLYIKCFTGYRARIPRQWPMLDRWSLYLERFRGLMNSNIYLLYSLMMDGWVDKLLVVQNECTCNTSVFL